MIYFYNKKPTRCRISQIYFGKELYMYLMLRHVNFDKKLGLFSTDKF